MPPDGGLAGAHVHACFLAERVAVTAGDHGGVAGEPRPGQATGTLSVPPAVTAVWLAVRLLAVP